MEFFSIVTGLELFNIKYYHSSLDCSLMLIIFILHPFFIK